MFHIPPALWLSAVSLGAGHALLGPDHSVPFIAMAWEGRWPLRRALVVTFLCGLGHVLSSAIIGLLAIGLNWKLSSALSLETLRGSWAGWALLSFGLLYLIWGLKRAYAGRHASGETPSSKKSWLFFLLFAFGPCEPLIPLLMYPASHHSAASFAAVTLFFGAATVATMLALVALALKGVRLLPLRRAERFVPALAGGAIFICGVAVVFLGL